MINPDHLHKFVALPMALVCSLMATTSIHSATMDPPHDPQGCVSCHDMTAFDQPNLIPTDAYVPDPGNIDWTLYNTTCFVCHNPGDILVHYHSSQSASTKYGTWSVECSVCHNQHMQTQPGKKFVRQTIDLSKINITPAKSGYKRVIFSGTTGPKSFADGDEIIDGICEVCHTETSHFKNDGSSSSGVGLHTGLTGTNCLQSCHPMAKGFEPDYQCLDCHDDPGNPETNIARTDVKQQFVSGKSHHVQRGDGSINNTDCYQCHWEADINGKLTIYHGAMPESVVDLVIYGTNTRPPAN